MDFSAGVAEGLRTHGHDAYRVDSALPANAADDAILALARREGRVLVTFDRGIAARLASSGGSAPSVITLSMSDRTTAGVLPVLLQILADDQDALVAGALVLYRATAAGVTKRVRRLPLTRHP